MLNKVSCVDPGQELSNGFCYEKCPNGYVGSGAVCLQNCPVGFVDHGAACEAPSVLRQTIKAFLQPCQPGQIDRNGDCFEPQTFTNGPQGPVQSGCGCIRRSRDQRLQCPQGYVKFNSACVSECPKGYHDINDDTGQISSLYCALQCPFKESSKQRWTLLGEMCVKPAQKRLRHKPAGLTQSGANQYGPYFGIPNSVLSSLARKPLGSSVNDRVRTGQSVGASNAASSNVLTEGWKQLLSQPILLVIIIFGGMALWKLGPPLFSRLGTFLGSLATSAGTVVQSVANVTAAGIDLAATNIKNVADNAKISK